MAGESQETPSTGRPDPSVLTTEGVALAISNAEKVLDARLSIRDQRLDGFAEYAALQAEMAERLRQADLKFLEERDRRLTEVAAEREKALKIKDEGDAKALRIKDEADKEARELAREAQRYKDEQANKLREQISAERGDYVSILAFKPVADYVTAQQARSESGDKSRSDLRLNAGQLLAFLAVLIAAAALLLR